MLGGCAATGQNEAVEKETRRLHVVVVGGGYGGATAARYLKKLDPTIEVTLVEYNKVYATAPGSNWVLGGIKSFPSLLVKYRKLEKLGIRVIHDWVSAVDVEGRNLRFDDDSRLGYDRLILAPGTVLDWKQIEGYDDDAAEKAPHAWKAGLQTVLLSKQLKTMRTGGQFIVSMPEGAMGCRQAAYERVSMAAHYLSQNNPRAKVILLDPLDTSPLRDRFVRVWERLYGFGGDSSVIDLITGRDMRLQKVDATARAVYVGAIQQRFKADVLNVIPREKAAVLAQAAGLVDDSGWCPVNPLTGESRLVPGIHVIGDAARLDDVGKHAAIASNMAKLCAHAIVASARADESLQKATLIDACYSLVSDKDALVSLALVSIDGSAITSRKDAAQTAASADHYKANVEFAKSWWRNSRADSWG
jgi:sulfide dehydrogenase [flavocytochrome c] flavoprotein subunit